MKKNIIPIVAIMLAMLFSAFTTKRSTTVYFIYCGSGHQKSFFNYSADVTTPAIIPGSAVLAWFMGSAEDPDAVTIYEFNDSFEAIDGDFGGADNDVLTDETEDHISIEKKTPNM